MRETRSFRLVNRTCPTRPLPRSDGAGRWSIGPPSAPSCGGWSSSTNSGLPRLRRRCLDRGSRQGSDLNHDRQQIERVRRGARTRSDRQSRTTMTSRTRPGAASREATRRLPLLLSRCKNAAQSGGVKDLPGLAGRIPRTGEGRNSDVWENTCSCQRKQNRPSASTGASRGVQHSTGCSRRSRSPQSSQLLAPTPRHRSRSDGQLEPCWSLPENQKNVER